MKIRKRMRDIVLAMVAMAAMSYGADYTWNGSAGDGDWANTANWVAGAVPTSLSAVGGTDAPDSITFYGANMPAVNLATFGGTYNNDSATMIFNSGGAFTLDVSTSFDSGPISEVARTWLTVGDGLGGAADVTVNITNMASTLRHASFAITNAVNADGVLNVNGDLVSYGSGRGAAFELNGGSMTLSGAMDTSFNTFSGCYIKFVAEGGSFTAAYGGAYTNFTLVQDDANDKFKSAPGIGLEFTSNTTSFTVSSILLPIEAAINVSTDSGVVPMEVVFDGTGSAHNEAEITSYSWDFGDGNTGSGGSVTHTYQTDGAFTATLTVEDALGNSDSATVLINAIGGASEVIALTADAANSSEAFYGTSIDYLLTDPFAYNPLLPTATLPALLHSDGFHGNNEDGSDVVLSFTLASPYTTVADNPVIVVDLWGRNSNQNRDDDIDIILYNGDYSTRVGSVTGVKVEDGTAPYGRATIKTSPAGTTFDRIQIIGHNSGGTSANAFTLTEVRLATIPGNVVSLIPVINASTTSGDSPLPVIFDGSESLSSAGIASYAWDFGDGRTASGVLVTNTYAAGDFTAMLTVMDVSSNSVSATVDITANVTVTPVISASVTNGASPLFVTFDGSGSIADEDIVSYDWDFGDGNTTSGESVDHTFDMNGTYVVTLTVTDALSNYASTDIEIHVGLSEDVAFSTSASADTNTPPTVSSVDLAQEYYLSSSATGLWLDRGADQGSLFDGALTNEVWLHTDASVTVNFDISFYKAGFDISGISTYFNSSDGGGGRANQGYRVVVTYMDDTTETIIGKDLWQPTGFYYTTVSFAATNGTVLATGVKSVTFDQFSPAVAAAYGDFSLAREFDIFGTYSISTEPPTISMTNGTTMAWETFAPQGYVVQGIGDLVYGSWTNVTSIVGTPPMTTYEMPIDDDKDVQFFRVNLAD